jgi:hypothetical protein
MQGVFQLPRFAVVVWVRKTASYPAIHDELLELAAEEPYESTEYQGMVDYHWGFDRMAQADQLASSLRKFAEKPEIVVLRIQSRDDATPSKTLKDERRVRH